MAAPAFQVARAAIGLPYCAYSLPDGDSPVPQPAAGEGRLPLAATPVFPGPAFSSPVAGRSRSSIRPNAVAGAITVCPA